MNGVLNLSVLDGWWPEACHHGFNGWQIGDAFESPDIEKQDAHDAAALYRVLKNEVVPTYYDNRAKWTGMMRASIQGAREEFAMQRMLDEYFDRLYSAAAAGKARPVPAEKAEQAAQAEKAEQAVKTEEKPAKAQTEKDERAEPTEPLTTEPSGDGADQAVNKSKD